MAACNDDDVSDVNASDIYGPSPFTLFSNVLSYRNFIETDESSCRRINYIHIAASSNDHYFYKFNIK